MPLRWTLVGLVAAGLGLLVLGPASAQHIFQYGFEARGVVWKPGSTDAAVKVLVHQLTAETAHGGQHSEHLRLEVTRGSFIHYTYDLPRALISDETTVSLWLKSNRPNVQLLCRIVFPRERDPKNLSQNLTALVRCEPYQFSTRWKLVDLRQPVKRLREQQQLLTKMLGREIDAAGAYIDQLVLNAYDGTGVIEVWIDDLEVGPVFDAKPPVTAEPVARTNPNPLAGARRSSEVMLAGNQLKVDGKKFFLRGIRHTGTPLRTLQEAGFNTVWLDESASATTIEEAASLGLWMVPSLQAPPEMFAPGRPDARLTAQQAFSRKTARFLEQDRVLAWDLGSMLGADHYTRALRLAEGFRTADPQRPVIADVWDGYKGFARSVPQLMLGTHRWPLFTSMELSAYRDWLHMRRDLSLNTYSWTWIQTHAPDWYVKLAYGRDAEQGFKEPIGPQPEQIRLLTYCALGTGYKGLAFWSDRFLADSHQGRDRLLAMALLNQELRLLEPILSQATETPYWIPTSRPEVAAAVIRTPQAVLVLPVWLGGNAQYVPGQSATAELSIVVQVPDTATAWEVSPGRIQSHPLDRISGGFQVKLRNFSLTAALVFTSDVVGSKGLIHNLQNEQRRMGRLAAQWACEQAREELAKVEQVHSKIEALGQALPDAQPLLTRAREALARAQQHRTDGEHSEAYGDAEVALRALRLLMRSHWERAVRDLDSPVASPYAVSYFTLPRHWEFLGELKRCRPGSTLLPHGDFELPPESVQPGWSVQEVPSLDAVEATVRRVKDAPHAGQQCLMINVRATDAKRPPAALERTYVALSSPAVKMRPGSLARISAWVRTAGVIKGSPDGALIYDSVGGEPLAVRVADMPKWRKFSLFRRVPASGQVSVTLAMSGLGTVYFDDVRIEPLEEGVAQR